ncbi:MAG: hypothetical protein NZM29_08940 [Nitrospira sp.]|nr:hypothetical protein [Nitrospira sp.]
MTRPVANDYAHAVQELLRLKTKAWEGLPWSANEQADINQWLGGGGNASILAACCVLAAERPPGCPESLGVIREALRRNGLPSYVELSVYEALIYVEVERLTPFRDSLLSFVEKSLTRRTINLDNTIFLLGKLARVGETRALELLRSLENDSNTEVRDSAIRVLNGLAAD